MGAAQMEDMLTVTGLARELDLTPRAIRFYESKGLLHPQRAGTTRVYTHRERGRLQIILRGKRLGFSLAEIREYLDLYDADPAQHDQLVLLLNKVSERLADLRRQQQDLEAILGELTDIRTQTLAALEQQPMRAVGADN
ncbi:MAG: MerR family DNA-binding transcriptional regulator [Arenicellales bacterium]|jgi:DNA-binding transcriptional MerR regulator|nr:MerR family DNA-binding transcriptional regulator [Arenicellales bacterium]MDP6313894.1 MerR family DNA-binding transcriptional regulator [Arenicellales bacterium]MDP7119164.1 MerR family DNA-binding transcriptional regulator [Arenicellales bacterium]MDP7193691.1 MerR family DNA-binding transcriptional regulator [Arenicellales bacterium]MDP7489476.1 MerR family DNA-binding transcriptional regulator [Arenicellales bacterium]|tara:strand:- start:89 stop:505 length:417 start_codon:yes stop_codon:yes gene_type:complete